MESGQCSRHDGVERCPRLAHALMLAHRALLLTSLLFVAWSNTVVEAFFSMSARFEAAHVSPCAVLGKRLDLLTFDLDDTIFPVGPVLEEANEAMIYRLKTFGYTYASNYQIIAASKRIRSELHEAGETLTYTDLRKQSIRREIMRLTKLQNHQVDESVVEDVFNSWLSTRHASADKNLFSDCVDALKAVREKHPDALIGAITNGRGNPLCMPSVKSFFDFCVSGEDDGVFPKRKPDKGIYEAALEIFFNLRGVSSDSFNWIHVGDDLANDVGASAACGAKSIWLSAKDDELASELPSWCTATKDELKRRSKLIDAAEVYVSAKISNLKELESAIMQILTSV